MSSPRIVGLGAAACLLVAIVYLPPRGGDVFYWTSFRVPERAEEVELRNELRGELDALKLFQRKSRTVSRLSAGAAWTVFVDPVTPHGLDSVLRERAVTVLDTMPLRASGVRFALGFFVDTMTRYGTLVLLPPRFVPSVFYVLPRSNDDACVTLATIGPDFYTSARERQPDQPVRVPLGDPEMLGPCSWIARFGVPGAGIRRWLEAGGYHAVGLLETRCSKGELEICREILVGRDGNPPPTDGPARVGIEGGLLQGNRPKLNRTDFAVLDRMLESIGDVSFRSVWSSDLALADAFAVEVDVSIEAWWAGVLKELRAEAPVRETTVVNRTQLGRSFLLIVATVLLSVAVSVRRRVA